MSAKELKPFPVEDVTTGVPDIAGIMERGADDVVPMASLGSGLKVIEDQTIQYTFGLADDFTKMKNFEAERPLLSEWVENLQREMRQGTFRYEQVILASCLLKDVEYRVNGQHTCWAWALLLSDPAFKHPRVLPRVRWVRYRASSDQDLRQLYATTDRGKARSRAHVVLSYLYGIEGFETVAKSNLKRLAEGLGPWVYGYDPNDQPPVDQLIYLMKTTHNALARKIAEFMGGSHKANRHIHRSPVCAAMYATFDVSHSHSVGFWSAVRDGAELAIDDPRLKLRNYLLTHSVVAGRGMGTAKTQSVSGEIMYRTCIGHWNAWRDGKTGKLLIPAAGERPKAK